MVSKINPTKRKTISQDFEAIKNALRSPIHRARSQRYKNISKLQNLDKKVADAISSTTLLPEPFKRDLQEYANQFQHARPSDRHKYLESIVDLLKTTPVWVTDNNDDNPEIMTWHKWSAQPLSTLKGVGPKREKQFALEGFETLGDLLLYLPKIMFFGRLMKTTVTFKRENLLSLMAK